MNIEDLKKHDPNEEIGSRPGEWDDFRALYFYKQRDGSFFPYYKTDIESCINDFYPKSVIEILKIMNYPFFEDEWISIVEKEIRRMIRTNHPYHCALGKYISKMNLMSFKNYTFKDSIYNKDVNNYKVNFSIERKTNKNG